MITAINLSGIRKGFTNSKDNIIFNYKMLDKKTQKKITASTNFLVSILTVIMLEKSGSLIFLFLETILGPYTQAYQIAEAGLGSAEIVDHAFKQIQLMPLKPF